MPYPFNKPAPVKISASGVQIAQNGAVTMEGMPAPAADMPAVAFKSTADDAIDQLVHAWKIGALTGVAAFGVAFNDEPDLLSSNSLGVHYFTDGRIVQDGVVVSETVAARAGDTLELAYDPFNEKMTFYLNGVEL